MTIAKAFIPTIMLIISVKFLSLFYVKLIYIRILLKFNCTSTQLVIESNPSGYYIPVSLTPCVQPYALNKHVIYDKSTKLSKLVFNPAQAINSSKMSSASI